MKVLWMLLAFTVLGTASVRTEPAASVRGLFDGAWKRAACNQPIDLALNAARYHDLGGGYSLGRVLCWLGPRSESHILFLVAPKTGGRPQPLQFQFWRNQAFVDTDVLPMAEYHTESRTLTSFIRYSGSGACGAAGEWSWTGAEFKLSGFWDKPDCKGDRAFDRDERYRVFPPHRAAQ